uniref:Phospholipid-transporting ATPase n=1 Tax=Plectus sambesii TaxID=2011161 RepID=A0A914VDH4_9BILA
MSESTFCDPLTMHELLGKPNALSQSLMSVGSLPKSTGTFAAPPTAVAEKMSSIFDRCCCALRRRKKPKETERRLKANDRPYNEQYRYTDNYIKTSKYNMFSFVPKNLFEQFQRLANAYFIFLMILQCVPWISSVPWETTALPLFFVLACTALKDGWDDLLIPWVSSIAWYSTAIPLFFVLFVSAVKDGYDDIQRHRSDNQVNNRISYVVRDGKLEEEKWMNVKVGDIIRMENDHFVAADLMLLSTSEPHGLCYVETAELDGETNLKARQALPETAEMGDSLEQIGKFRAEVTCESPNNNLNRFEGRMVTAGQTLPIDNEKMLLRGCILRNTRWCYGLVIFAGRDTKLMMNSGKTKFKRTSLDRFLNVLIMGIVLFLLSMCLICSILCGVWEYTTGKEFQGYLKWDDTIVPGPPGEKGFKQIVVIAFLMFFSYVILLNTVVPISLYVSVEIIRFMHSWWINWDEKMYYAKGDVASRARTTTLNEELGQVQYIFSDKTGTLTQNIMTFNKCSINGHSYGDVTDELGNVLEIDERMKPLDFSFNPLYEPKFTFYDENLLKDVKRGNKEVSEFWRLLALCHTVMPDRKNGQLVYQAQSPDEEALTSAARNFGFVFKSRTPRSITIEVNGEEETYELLCILDFNNVRKRMSVILKDSEGHIKLYCKGADTMILARLSTDSSERLHAITNAHLDKFATEGLRTLCLAVKPITDKYWEKWQKRQQDASVALENRQDLLDAIYEEIETDMTLIGATAIEDKLQDGVPETIANLAAANIKIWVLTGDKQETAINIGYSCRLLTENMREVFVVDGEQKAEVEVQLKDIKRRLDRANGSNGRPGAPQVMIASIQTDNGVNGTSVVGANNDQLGDDGEPTEGYALVINGPSLHHALSPALERTFLDIGCACQAVVCCRVTPLQKAMVVDLVKRNKKAVTLSVGDGANDVSMIKTAHIGVGISGQEGMQAVLASDYSIGQFRYLERLLLVHGRWSYFRMSKFLRYFFYKNFAFTLAHFWYAFFCGYSAQTVYDPVFIACYNLFFTSLPVLILGMFDQDVDDAYSMRFPKLYIPGQYNLFFNMRIFIYSVLHGLVSSLVLFFIPYGTMHLGYNYAGLDMNDYSLLAFTVFSSLVVIVTIQIALDTSYWTVFNHICIWGSLIFYFSLTLVYYEALPFSWVNGSQSAANYGVAFRAMASPHYWLSMLLTAVVLLLPVVANRFFWQDTQPSYSDRLRVRQQRPREMPKKGPTTDLPMRPFSRKTTSRRSRRGSLRSGYAFSHQQGFGELITKGKLFPNLGILLPSTGSAPGALGKGASSSHAKKSLSPIREQPPGFIAAAAAALPGIQLATGNLFASTESIESGSLPSVDHIEHF